MPRIILSVATVLVLIAVAIACGLYGGLASPTDVMLIRDGIAIRAHDPLATQVGVFLNLAGGAPVMLAIAVGGPILLWVRHQHRRAAAFFAIVIVGRLFVETVKLLVHRARPALDPHPVLTHSLSFPSAHAANSMIALTSLAMFFVSGSRRWVAVVLAVVASLIIGASRALLGVHWPSDVVAGWSIGAAWVLICWPVAQRLAPVEPQHDVVGGQGAAIGEP